MELSLVEFEVCWEFLALGDLPPFLTTPLAEQTFQQRKEKVNSALATLRGRGLADNDGLAPDLTNLLLGLGRFEWAVNAWLTGEHPVRARGASTGVLGILDGDRVLLRRVPVEDLLCELVALAQQTPANVVSLRHTEVKALRQQLIRSGLSEQNARVMSELVDNADWRGQFTVSVCTPDGVYSPLDSIGFHATPHGQVMHSRSATRTTILPATPDAMVNALSRLRDELAA
ncbi:ESX secretion-associated protein EspG [Pseudonocardiaceae bacterium YIM PH 21723]|nr:ESX secretion-associated protein EspG [Pseudonocardiaceae bacterium YIM PH 21723]